MKDKDTILLQEAYTNINENKEVVYVKDETSLKPQPVGIISHNDGTMSLQFSNRFSLSHVPKEDLAEFIFKLHELLNEKEPYGRGLPANEG